MAANLLDEMPASFLIIRQLEWHIFCLIEIDFSYWYFLIVWWLIFSIAFSLDLEQINIFHRIFIQNFIRWLDEIMPTVINRLKKTWCVISGSIMLHKVLVIMTGLSWFRWAKRYRIRVKVLFTASFWRLLIFLFYCRLC